MKKLIPGLLLIFISTLCFYVPAIVFNLDGFDVSTVPERFYLYYAWMMAGALSLNIIYAFLLFKQISFNNLALKIPVSWLVIAETYTLIYHIVNKIYLQNVSSAYGKIGTIILFSICCVFFLYRSAKKQKSDPLFLNRTYEIIKPPKNMLGFINYLLRMAGHIEIYQDGLIYKISRREKIVVKIPATINYLTTEDIVLKEKPRAKNIESLDGKKFNIFIFNCNHLLSYAQRAT